MMFVSVADFVFFFKQKTAYEMRISDWSSDVCSSDLRSSSTSSKWGLSFMVSYCHDTREEGRAKTLLSSPFPMRTDPKGGRISSKASGRPASSSSFHHASPHVRPWSRCRPDLYPFLQKIGSTNV